MDKKCLEPWINEKTRILIIGTMPGEESLQKQTYYANSRNKFWSYIQNILNNGQELKTIDEKKNLLLSKGIGLWDSLSICKRYGSLDSNIKHEYPNDFSKFQYVQYLLFNGQQALKYFKSYNNEYLMQRKSFNLPSTSPANTSISDEIKFEKWKKALLSIIEE